MYVRRELSVALRRALRSFPAVLVTGARQSGKTTLLRHEIGQSHAYVSLDRPEVRARALADPVAFLAEQGERIVLDEIQNAPALLHHVKASIDADRRPGRFVLSGSQSLALMAGVSESLAGRVAVLTLEPLSASEVAGGRPRDVERVLTATFGQKRASSKTRGVPAVPDWLLRGGYPELRARRSVDRRLWFSSYVQTYLERDVRSLVHVGDLGAFSRFLALAAARTATLLNVADLARDAGVAAPTVHRWLSVLESSHVVHLVRPHHRNFGKRLVKAPKLYFRDPGLCAFLVGLHDAEPLRAGPMYGPLFETAVVGEWLKLFHNLGERAPLFHFRSSAGLEVDLVVEWNGALYGIEAKATATPTPTHADALARWLELAGPGARGVVACAVPNRTALRPGVAAVPWHLTV